MSLEDKFSELSETITALTGEIVAMRYAITENGAGKTQAKAEKKASKPAAGKAKATVKKEAAAKPDKQPSRDEVRAAVIAYSKENGGEAGKGLLRSTAEDLGIDTDNEEFGLRYVPDEYLGAILKAFTEEA